MENVPPVTHPLRLKCLHTRKQKLPHDNLIAKSTVLMVYLKTQDGPQTIKQNESDKHLK